MSKVSLIEKKEVAEGTMAFYFEKPKNFDYAPGQFFFIHLVNQGLSHDNLTRHFSLITTPSEDKIGFATRMRAESGFKTKLKELPLGTEVEIDGPYGKFVLPKTKETPLVFLAGGIGITPFYSMLKESYQLKLDMPITLFYANRSPKSTAFMPELEKMKGGNFQMIPIMSDLEIPADQWIGERGIITGELVKKYAPHYQEAVFYIAGPPPMAKALRQMLSSMDISSSHIKIETFTGY